MYKRYVDVIFYMIENKKNVEEQFENQNHKHAQRKFIMEKASKNILLLRYKVSASVCKTKSVSEFITRYDNFTPVCLNA